VLLVASSPAVMFGTSISTGLASGWLASGKVSVGHE